MIELKNIMDDPSFVIKNNSLFRFNLDYFLKHERIKQIIGNYEKIIERPHIFELLRVEITDRRPLRFRLFYGF